MSFKTRYYLIARLAVILALLSGIFGALSMELVRAESSTSALSTSLTLTVNSLLDAVDANPGNGVCETATNNSICTLRAAIQETNVHAGADTILIPAGTYTLTLPTPPGVLEDAAANGDLDIVGDLTISGESSTNTIIDGNGGILYNRVFHIIGTYHVDISSLTIGNGNPSGNNGGGIYNSGGVLSLYEVTLSDNRAHEGGGLINVGTAYLLNTTVVNNIATAGGGIRNSKFLTVVNSTISDNWATGAGGGIQNHGSITLINSTISHNQAGNFGGGILVGYRFVDQPNATVDLNNVTITNNLADADHNGYGDGGGIYMVPTGIVNLQDTILAGNIGPSGSPDCYGTLTSNGYNLIESTSGCIVTGITTGNLIGVSPDLGPLQDNDGLTLTHALQPDSPAVDAGNDTTCQPTDQRGVSRPQGSHCDIGAYEYDSPRTPTPPTVTRTPTITMTTIWEPVTSTATNTATATNTFTPPATRTPTTTQTSTPTQTTTPTSTFIATRTTTSTVTVTPTITLVSPPTQVGIGQWVGGPQDGWVLETSETSNRGGAINPTATTFVLGDNENNQQYRSILSFNTASLPDNAVITKVVLKIKKRSATGTDPFTSHKNITIDVRRGAFSNANPLQATDFQAAASKNGVGLIANNPQAGGWYVSNLKAVAYPHINRMGITQFRLRFQLDDDNDAIADFLRFYSGNAMAANRPVLVIEYYVP